MAGFALFLMTHIMLLEDEEPIREVMGEVLNKLGYEVTSYSNGSEGLVALTLKKPDIILTDMIMPEMDGLDFMKEYYVNHMIDVRAPVELITGYTPPEKLDRAYIFGQSVYDFLKLKDGTGDRMMFKHINKPISMDLLGEKLSSVEDAIRNA